MSIIDDILEEFDSELERSEDDLINQLYGDYDAGYEDDDYDDDEDDDEDSNKSGWQLFLETKKDWIESKIDWLLEDDDFSYQMAVGNMSKPSSLKRFVFRNNFVKKKYSFFYKSSTSCHIYENLSKVATVKCHKSILFGNKSYSVDIFSSKLAPSEFRKLSSYNDYINAIGWSYYKDSDRWSFRDKNGENIAEIKRIEFGKGKSAVYFYAINYNVHADIVNCLIITSIIHFSSF